MRKITETMLRRACACARQRDLFIELFPTGVVPTREVCASVANKFDWSWAAACLLPSAAQLVYNGAIALADRAYDEANAAAWRAYDEARAAAWRAYDEARAAADRTYDEAWVAAWRAHAEAMAAAQRAHAEACALRLRAHAEAYAVAFADAWASV